MPQLERARIMPPEERMREPVVRAMLGWVLVYGLAYRERLVRVAREREIRRRLLGRTGWTYSFTSARLPGRT
jgi:hypothetical protein